MKKIISVMLAVLFAVLSLCGCSSKEKEYIDVVNQYVKEKYSASIEKGQDTYVKVVEDNPDVEAYVYAVASMDGDSTEGIMYIIKKGGLEAYKNEESVRPFVTAEIPKVRVDNPYGGADFYVGDFEAPTLEELEDEWEHFES